MYFENDDKMNDYMRSKDYGANETIPAICFGVSFKQQTNGQYIYSLRYNISSQWFSFFPQTSQPPIDYSQK